MIEFVNTSEPSFAAFIFPAWNVLIKSTIAIALTTFASSLLRRKSAALRHRVWLFGLAASLVAPMTWLLIPQFTIHVLPSPVDASAMATTPVLNRQSSTSTGETGRGSTDTITANSDVERPELDVPPSTVISGNATNTVRTSSEVPPDVAGYYGIGQMLVDCWLVGTMVSLTLFLTSFARQSMRLSRLRRIEDGDWVKSVAAAAEKIGLQRSIVTLESNEACVPAVVGVLRSRLMVPRDWRSWSLPQRHCILLHELAHVKRCDVLTQSIGRLALISYWFNPLVWHAFRQLRAERELASDDCVLLTGQTANDYAEQLLKTLQFYRPVRSAIAVTMAHSARLDQRILAILDPRRRRAPVGTRLGIILPCIIGVMCLALGGVTLSPHDATAKPPGTESSSPSENVKPVWKENYTVEYPGSLPVSVAFSADGNTLLTGDTGGEIMALVFSGDRLLWRWKANVEGSHAAAAFAADLTKIYATTEHGICILDADRGREEARIEVKDSNPTAIGVFPDRDIAQDFTNKQIVFGNPRGYFVKSWAKGKLADTIGTIETSTVPRDARPVDGAAVPLAVDPNGRSAIMTGPIDATGRVSGVKGKNVLWAYVCGDYGEGSPGNRVMVGHSAIVVSAAWSKEGGTAVTGDSAGRVIA